MTRRRHDSTRSDGCDAASAGILTGSVLLPLVLILPLIIFWIWMFRDMLNNNDLSDTAKSNWTVAFIVLNVFAAVFYYVYEYRSRRR